MLDFGPVISAGKATELRDRVSDAMHRGAVPLWRGSLADGRFIAGPGHLGLRRPGRAARPPGARPR